VRQFLLSRLKSRWLPILGASVIAALHIHRDLVEYPERIQAAVSFFAVVILLIVLLPDKAWKWKPPFPR